MLNNIGNLVIIPLLLSTIFCYLITPLVIKIAWKTRIIDDPKKHKHAKVIHTKPIPRGGGLAIFLAVFFSVLILLPLDKHILGIMLGATVLVVMGIVDDISTNRPQFTLSPYLRLFIQFIAALMPIGAGIGIAYLFNTSLDLSAPRISFELLGGTHSIWVLADLFALFWIVSIINFVNMGAKGVDGQLSGVVVISALTIAILSFRFSADITEWPVTILASITAGAFLGFLPWHIFPQKIMPSFAGSNLAGYLLAVLAILSTTKTGTLMVVLAIPLIDTSYTIIRRILSGKSPLKGDTGHLHHRLLHAGLTKSQVAYLYWAITATLGFLALNLNSEFKLYTIVGVTLFLGGLLLWLTRKSK